MGRREKVFRRYLKALDRLERTSKDEVTVELRNAKSLKELALVPHIIVERSDLEHGQEYLMVVDSFSRQKQREFFFSGWARKAGLVKVPLLRSRE